MKWSKQAKKLLSKGTPYEIKYPTPTSPSVNYEKATEQISWDKAEIKPYQKINHQNSIAREEISNYKGTTSLCEVAREQSFREIASKMKQVVNQPTIPLLLEKTEDDGMVERHHYKLILSSFKYYPNSQDLESIEDLEVPIKQADLEWTKKQYSLNLPSDMNINPLIENEKEEIYQEYYENLTWLVHDTNKMFIFYPKMDIDIDDRQRDPFTIIVDFNFNGSVYWLEADGGDQK